MNRFYLVLVISFLSFHYSFGQGVILYDQITNLVNPTIGITGHRTATQHSPSGRQVIADDFEVVNPQGWEVGGFRFVGSSSSSSNSPVNELIVDFYTHNMSSCTPNTLLRSDTISIAPTTTFSNYLVELPPFTLSPGRYWVAISGSPILMVEVQFSSWQSVFGCNSNKRSSLFPNWNSQAPFGIDYGNLFFQILEPDYCSDFDVSFTVNDELSGDDGAIDITVVGGSGVFSYSWANDDLSFLSNTEDISGLSAGTYTLTITDSNNCEIIETIVVDSQVGFPAITQQEVSVYPNPARNNFQVILPSTLSGVAEIYNTNGQILNVKTFSNASQIFFETEKYLPGVYWLKLKSKDFDLTKKLIIQ